MPTALTLSGEAFFDPAPADGVLEDADLEIHPGFGCVTLCRSGVEHRRDATGERTLGWYEAVIRRAAKPHQPTSVWTLHIDGPFTSLVYALTPEYGWALIETKEGFA